VVVFGPVIAHEHHRTLLNGHCHPGGGVEETPAI
jgi:hypothetical protein